MKALSVFSEIKYDVEHRLPLGQAVSDSHVEQAKPPRPPGHGHCSQAQFIIDAFGALGVETDGQ